MKVYKKPGYGALCVDTKEAFNIDEAKHAVTELHDWPVNGVYIDGEYAYINKKEGIEKILKLTTIKPTMSYTNEKAFPNLYSNENDSVECVVVKTEPYLRIVGLWFDYWELAKECEDEIDAFELKRLLQC